MYSQPTQISISDQPRLANLDESQISSNQEAIPLPWFCGRDKLALKWITEPLNIRTTEIQQKIGKSTETTGHKFHVDIAGIIAAGPIDRITHIWKSKELIWQGDIRRDTAPYEDIQVGAHATTLRIYWGTDTQTPDPLVLNAASSPSEQSGDSASAEQDHPAYHGIAYLVLHQLHAGDSSIGSAPPVPDIEVMVERQAHNPLNLPAEVTATGVNPLSALAQLLTDSHFGLGWSTTRFDIPTWQDVALRLTNQPDAYHICPHLHKSAKFRQFWGDTLSYFDGFGTDRHGRLAIGFYPHDGIIPSGLTELSHHQQIGETTITSPGYEHTLNQVTVEHREHERLLKEDSKSATSLYNKGIVGEVREERLSKPFFITGQQALRFAQEAIQTAAVPEESGTTTYEYHAATHPDGTRIRPGDRFHIDDSDYRLDLIVRCTARQDHPFAGTTTLDWVRERGLFAMDYSAPDTPYLPPVHEVPAIQNAAILRLPASLAGTTRTTMALLAERPAPYIQGFDTWMSDDQASYDLLESRHPFALRATLQSTLPAIERSSNPNNPTPEDIPTTLELTLTENSLDSHLLQGQSPQFQNDNTLLAIIGSELLSIGALTPLGDYRYRIHTYRGRYKSTMALAYPGQNLWIITRASLMQKPLNHADFAQDITKHFKLQTYRAATRQPLEDAYTLSHTFEKREITPPEIVFDHDKNDYNGTTGEPMTFYGHIEDANEDIDYWSAYVIKNGDETNTRIELENHVTAATGYIPFAITHTPLNEGQYGLYIDASDVEEGERSVVTKGVGFNVELSENGRSDPEGLLIKIGDAEEYLGILNDQITQITSTISTISDEIIAGLDTRLNELSEETDGLGADFIEHTNKYAADGIAFAERIDGVLAVANTAKAGVESAMTAIANGDNALAQQYTALLTRMDSADGRLNGMASDITFNRSEVQRIEDGVQANALAYNELRSQVTDLDGSTVKNQAFNALVSTAIANDTLIRGMNSALTKVNTWYDGHVANVDLLLNTFIEGNEVRAGALLNVRADGKIAGLRLLVGSGGVQDFSLAEFEAEKFRFIIDGQPFLIAPNQDIAQITRTDYSIWGKPAWGIQEKFGAIFIKEHGNSTGGEVKFRVHAPNDDN